jgi:hypothetical protein
MESSVRLQLQAGTRWKWVHHVFPDNPFGRLYRELHPGGQFDLFYTDPDHILLVEILEVWFGEGATGLVVQIDCKAHSKIDNEMWAYLERQGFKTEP